MRKEKIMTEKTKKLDGKNVSAVKTAVKRGAAYLHWKELITENVIWGLAALLLEFGSGGVLGTDSFSKAPGGAALAAGLSGNRGLFAMVGGAIGALLHGFPDAVTGLAAIAIVLAARILPDLHNPKIRAAERFLASGIAVFFSQIAQAVKPSDFLELIIASLASALFTVCVCVLSDSAAVRGIDLGEPRDCSLGGIITALGFMSLGALDYSAVNVGRLLLGFVLLTVTAKRGLSRCAVIGISAVFGLCAVEPGIGAGAALLAFSAMASSVFIKYGKLARAAGYLLFSVCAILVSGIDEASWRIVVESAVGAAAFVIVPVEKSRVSSSESDFSDKTVALMLRERLNFAADAISGIGAGINAAAETLDRRYNSAPEKIPEMAADKCCSSCPNSMKCWGKCYDMFSAEFSRLTAQLRMGFKLTEDSLSGDCAEICVNPGGVIKAVTEEYLRYISAASDERRIRELRRIYVDQLAGVRDILRDMGDMKSEVRSANRAGNAERRAEKILAENGVELPQAFVMLDKRNRLRLEAYGTTEPRVDMEYLGTLLSRALGRELAVPELSGSRGRYRITAGEKTALSAKVGAFQIPRGQNRVCGDCYESFTDAAGMLYVILSDGMGSGSRAYVDSAMACSVLSKLIKSGISLKVALETVNTVLMVKSADESYATLDICCVDLNSGECAVYKAGASTTYIKSADRLIRAVLPSQPAGSGGRLTVPAQRFTVSAGDVILMMTDGAAPDEKWLSRELSRRVDPNELSERIARAARGGEYARDDDISVIALQVS